MKEEEVGKTYGDEGIRLAQGVVETQLGTRVAFSPDGESFEVISRVIIIVSPSVLGRKLCTFES